MECSKSATEWGPQILTNYGLTGRAPVSYTHEICSHLLFDAILFIVIVKLLELK